MAQLPFEYYLPRPDEPSGVLWCGKSPEQTESDRAAGVARIGAFRAPDYSQAYLLSANTLLQAALEKDALDHHSLPIFFLQRHALELIIKSHLKIGMDIQEYRKRLKHKDLIYPNKKQLERLEKWHGLTELLADLDLMAGELGVGPVPDVLRLVVDEILVIEQQHTWSRYSYRWDKDKDKETRSLVRHMESQVVVPLIKIQKLLQEANMALGTVWPFDPGLMMGRLGELYMSLAREVGDVA